jgi:hypothetical protein
MIKIFGVLVMTALLEASSPSSPLERFSFVIGNWNSNGESFPESFGATAGPDSGTVDCVWGTKHAWISLDSTLKLPSGGSYTVHVVTAARPETTGLTAFAVNTISGAGVGYEGEMTSSDRAVFVGCAGRKWQRVSYTRVDQDHVEIFIEEAGSREGPWIRHSRQAWTRRP